MYHHGYRYPSIQTRGLLGAAEVPLPAAGFDVDMAYTLIPTFTAGSGYVYGYSASNSNFSMVDFEGITKYCVQPESAHNGVRRVHNLCTQRTDVMPTHVISLTKFNDYVVSFEGDGQIVFTTGIDQTLVGQAGKRVTTGVVNSTWTNTTMTVTGNVLNVLVEDVTGQANQNPSRYVSRGVDSYPWGGQNADGVQYYNVENGNTVAAGVVTYADGDPIDVSLVHGASIWKGTNNYYNTANGDGVRTTGTTPAGNITVWLKGEGVTAVVANNGADGSTVVDEDTPYTFTSTGGTHELTITGTADKVQKGDAYIIQVERGQFPTPFFKSGGSWNRTNPELEFGSENYSDEMTAVIEFELPYGSGVGDFGEEQNILGFYDRVNDWYTFHVTIKSDGTVQLYVADDATDVYLYTTTTVSAGKHKIAVTRSNTRSLIRMYMDGVDIETSSSGGDPSGDADLTNEFHVGMSSEQTNWINGYISRVRVWNEPFAEDLLAQASTL